MDPSKNLCTCFDIHFKRIEHFVVLAVQLTQSLFGPCDSRAGPCRLWLGGFRLFRYQGFDSRLRELDARTAAYFFLRLWECGPTGFWPGLRSLLNIRAAFFSASFRGIPWARNASRSFSYFLGITCLRFRWCSTFQFRYLGCDLPNVLTCSVDAQFAGAAFNLTSRSSTDGQW
ncbi:MAG: hypothetical protein ACE5FM_08520, partial [Methyloligellaceae bacterium]